MFKRKFKQLALTTSIAALLSLLMMSSSPAYAIPTITIVTEGSLANVVDLLRWDFENAFCTDPANPSGDSTCDVSLVIMESARIRDEIVNSGSAGVRYDLFLSSDSDPTDLYYKYQFSHPNVVVGKPFQFASDSVILYSGHALSAPFDVSSGFPKNLADGVKFAMADPVADSYGAVSARILSTLPNFKAALSHAKIANDGYGAYVDVNYYGLGDIFNEQFGFVPKSAACFFLQLNDPTMFFDFSQKENLKAINTIPLTGVTLTKERIKDEKALLDSFVSYITGKSNGNGTYSAADELKSNCYQPIASKLEN